MFLQKELKRYSRQIIIPEIGIEGQQKIKNANVLVVGAGGLGSPVLQYLTAAGVGTIGILDYDIVDETNLQRQILYDTDDIGKPKAEIAKKKLLLKNPYINFNVHKLKINKNNALDIIKDYDVIIDGSDNFPTRYLINDACVILNKPLIFGAVIKFEGQLSVFNYNNGPTYRCLFPIPPDSDDVPNCSTVGVLGMVPGIIGNLQASEAIKIITGKGEVLSGKILVIDVLTMSFQVISIQKNKEYSNIKSLMDDYDEFCGVKEVCLPTIKEITPSELKQKIDNNEDIQLIDIREPFEYQTLNLKEDRFPIGSIPENVSKISKTKMVVIICQYGSISQKVIKYLENSYGFDNLYNLKGGIDALFEETKK